MCRPTDIQIDGQIQIQMLAQNTNTNTGWPLTLAETGVWSQLMNTNTQIQSHKYKNTNTGWPLTLAEMGVWSQLMSTARTLPPRPGPSSRCFLIQTFIINIIVNMLHNYPHDHHEGALHPNILLHHARRDFDQRDHDLTP